MSDAKAIKKHAAQHDLFNRLHSIAADEKFVAKVAQTWFNGRFEVIGKSLTTLGGLLTSSEPALRYMVLRPHSEWASQEQRV